MKAYILCAAAWLWLGFAPPAAAIDLNAVVPGHPGLTFLDLTKLIVTDLDPAGDGGAVGHNVVPFAHIEGQTQTGRPAPTVNLRAIDVDTMAIPGAESRILLLVDLGGQEDNVAEVELLALIALAPAPKLLDVVEVGTDRVTVFSQKDKPVMLAPRSPLILIESGHDDAEEDFTAIEMMFVRNDRFQWIGGFSTRDEQLCAYKRQEPWFVSALPGADAYPVLHVAVVEHVTPTGEKGCGDQQKAPRPRVTTYQANYRWDRNAQRFVTQSSDMRRLDKENENAL